MREYYEPATPGSPYVQAQYNQPIQQQPSWRQPQKAEENIDFDFGPPAKPHPYQKLPEQTQYLLQQMPVQFKKPANGTLPQQQPLQEANRAPTTQAAGSVKPPSFLQNPQPQVAALGSSVTFTAKVTGQPAPQVTWVQANGQQIKNDNKKYQISASGDTHTFTIKNIQQQDIQNYACIAKNTGGAVQSGFNIALQGLFIDTLGN